VAKEKGRESQKRKTRLFGVFFFEVCLAVCAWSLLNASGREGEKGEREVGG
jgi:hypothetical protein